MTRLFAGLFISLFMAVSASAQDAVWVQVEAQPSLGQAQSRVRAYASQVENVAGFYLGSGWYGVVLGPYSDADASRVLRQLRSDRVIPSDSFIARGGNFGQQFWPVGATSNTVVTPSDETGEEAVVVEEVAEIVVPDPIEEPDETLREARASERLLDRDEKKLLQVALQWAGFYTAAIDGSYGRGTRASMTAWQDANNHETTGTLTTKQRAQLLGQYNAVLDGMGLETLRDDASGVQMIVPTGVVAFDHYEPPFARFAAKSDIAAQVLFISQEGNQDRLFGLYEIMQTLEIVPRDGERTRRNNSFELEGLDDKIHSYTYAALDDGEIKGFTLIWPAGDEERFRRVLAEMKASFTSIEGVLDPALAVPGEDQAIDLISGLQVRRPMRSRTGFYVDGRGAVLTTTEAVAGCTEISIADSHIATIAHLDEALGLAVLKPIEALAPLGVAEFQTGVPRLQTAIAVAGFPYEGVLTQSTLTFGTLADIRGLAGEDTLKRLSLTAQPGDAGGPVFDDAGAVLGMLLPKANTNGQVLPAEVSFLVDAEAIGPVLNAAGVTPRHTEVVSFMAPEVLTNESVKMTVLVSCWN